MFASIKELVEKVKSGIEKEVARFNNKDFLEATVAGCAMVASSDGSISAEEKQKMWGYMQISPALRVFKADEVLESWNRHVTNFEFDAAIGAQEAGKAIAKLNGNADASRTLVNVCCAIGASDGDFDDTEKDTVRKICGLVGLRPSEFGLN